MLSKLIGEAGGWRSIAAGFIILSFLGFVGLLTLSGHSPHVYIAIAYLLIAGSILASLAPIASTPESDKDSDPDAGFRIELDVEPESAECKCSESTSAHHNKVEQ